MNEKTKAGIEASLELFKGWVRPIVVIGMTAIICIMTYEDVGLIILIFCKRLTKK